MRSLLVVAKKPIEKAKRIALDTSSRSTAALVRMLAAEEWRIQPEFVDAAPNVSEMLQDADAALVIGDPALRISLKMETLAGKQPSGERVLPGRSRRHARPGIRTIFVYDMAHQWRQMTGKPCVLAIWAAQREAVSADWWPIFRRRNDMGSRALAKLRRRLRLSSTCRPGALERYLTENIQFDLDEENLAGLRLYFEKAAAMGLIPAGAASNSKFVTAVQL